MPAANALLVQFAPDLIAALSCHGRVLFKGHLPFAGEAHRNRFVGRVRRIPRKDRLAFAEQEPALLVARAKDFAARHRAPYL